MESIIRKIPMSSSIVLSMDLDNTLVNRQKGDNYVSPQIMVLIELIKKLPNVFLLPNTGRDVIGFNSFINATVDFPNAILGAGSIIKVDNRYIFDYNSEIKWETVSLFIESVGLGVFPFIDLTSRDGRLIIYNETNGRDWEDLFFSQNPRSWFGENLPPIVSHLEVKNIDCVFRIEFPVFSNQGNLYDELINRRENGLEYLCQIMGIPLMDSGKFTVKRKAFFREKYKNRLSFARFEKHSEFSSKGHGIKMWLTEKRINNFKVIHIGDQDYGIANDTLVKTEIPESLLVMVGNRCTKENPLVDLYLGDEVDSEIYNFLNFLYTNLKKYI